MPETLSRLLQDHPWLPEITSGLSCPWAVAGGWAIDLFLGRVTRPHDDLEITILRNDQMTARAALNGWDLAAIDKSKPTHWTAKTRLALPIHEIHAQRGDKKLEILLSEHEGENWLYRRDRRVALPLRAAFVAGPMPYLAPELVLLFKSKNTRPKDEQDFFQCVDMLKIDQRRWLRTALALTVPEHAWIKALA